MGTAVVVAGGTVVVAAGGTEVVAIGGVVLLGVLAGLPVPDGAVVVSLLLGVVAADIVVSVDPGFDCVSCEAVAASRLQPSISTPPNSST